MNMEAQKVTSRNMTTLNEILERNQTSVNLSSQLSAEVSAFLRSVMSKKSSLNQGLVSLLELLYEHLGLRADFEGQVILDEIINILETETDYKRPPEEPAKPKKTKAATAQTPPLPDLSNPIRNPAKKPSKETKPQVEQPSDSGSEKNRGKQRADRPAQASSRQRANDDDGFGDLQITTYTAEDLKRERQANGEEKKYLAITDISPGYEYDYIEEYDAELFDRIEEKFRGASLVGVDTECHLRREKATYMQLSTDTYGIVFNIRSIKLREHDRVKSFVRRLLETAEVKKVGHSLGHDRKMIKQAFFGDIEFNGNTSLEDIFFTAPLKTNILGLSSMCLRAFGFPLNKDLQSHIGEQESLFCDEEKEYAILDALAPVVLYNKFRKAIDAKIPLTKFVVNCQDRYAVKRGRFLLDHNLELLRVYFLSKNLEFEILKDKTYEGSFRLPQNSRRSRKPRTSFWSRLTST